MRSYGQFCALARTLDVIGDRWTLLIVRELFARDSRYSDLRDGLPGIATNMLATRLRHLEVHGVIETRDAARPVNATVYQLTPRGRELAPALAALVSWGLPLVAAGQNGDEFRTHWLVLALRGLFEGVDASDLAPFTAVIHTGDAPAVIRVTGPGNPAVDIATWSEAADVTLTGSPDAVTAFVNDGTDMDIRVDGDDRALAALRTLLARARADANE